MVSHHLLKPPVEFQEITIAMTYLQPAQIYQNLQDHHCLKITNKKINYVTNQGLLNVRTDIYIYINEVCCVGRVEIQIEI